MLSLCFSRFFAVWDSHNHAGSRLDRAIDLSCLVQLGDTNGTVCVRLESLPDAPSETPSLLKTIRGKGVKA